MNIGKVLLIFFEGNEEKVIDSIISVLGVGREICISTNVFELRSELQRYNF